MATIVNRKNGIRSEFHPIEKKIYKYQNLQRFVTKSPWTSPWLFKQAKLYPLLKTELICRYLPMDLTVCKPHTGELQ
jgi:hypothetical protein